MSQIERELTKEKKRFWIKRIKESKFAIGLLSVVVILLSWNIYRSADKVTETVKSSGALQGIHQSQGYLGSTTTMLSVKLDNGDTVLIVAPGDFVAKDKTELNVIQDKTQQGATYYYFNGYRKSK